jgi:hypothetical protein
MEDIPALITNLGIGGALAVVFVWSYWHLIRTTIPDMLKAFREELQAERHTSERVLGAEREAHERHMNMLVERLTGIEHSIRSLVDK